MAQGSPQGWGSAGSRRLHKYEPSHMATLGSVFPGVSGGIRFSVTYLTLVEYTASVFFCTPYFSFHILVAFPSIMAWSLGLYLPAS